MTNVVLPVLVLKHPPPNLKQGDKPMTDMCWADQRKLAEDWWQPPYLLLGFKDITPEDIAGTISRDIAEDLQVLGIMRDVEDPRGKKNQKNTLNVAFSPECQQETSDRGEAEGRAHWCQAIKESPFPVGSKSPCAGGSFHRLYKHGCWGGGRGDFQIWKSRRGGVWKPHYYWLHPEVANLFLVTSLLEGGGGREFPSLPEQ